MAHTIEILIAGKSPRKIKEKDHAIINFIKYLDEDYPGWEESIISNKQIYLVKSRDRLFPLEKAPAVGHLLDYLEQHHQDWLRFGISRITFPIIKYEDCRPGMLVRPSSTNTSMYQRVEKVVINSREEKEIICCQEGNTRTFNTVRNKKFRFALLAANIPAADLKAIDWPGRK